MVLVCVMLMGSIGMHWTLLQSAAWTGMLVSNLHSGDRLSEALQKTFDGKHPCRLCVAVEQGRKAESKSASAPSIPKFEFQRHAQLTVLPPEASSSSVSPQGGLVLQPRTESPLLQPPRLA